MGKSWDYKKINLVCDVSNWKSFFTEFKYFRNNESFSNCGKAGKWGENFHRILKPSIPIVVRIAMTCFCSPSINKKPQTNFSASYDFTARGGEEL